MQLTIEITEEQHRYMKTSAAFEGKSIGDFILEKTMADEKENGEFPEKENTPSKTEFIPLSEKMKKIRGKPIPSPMSNFARLFE